MSTAGELSGTPLPRRFKKGDLDWFIEPSWAVDLLLDNEPFTGSVWDPACGIGTIVRACQARGVDAHGSDIVDRGFGAVRDFLDPQADFNDVENIVSNPPYGRAASFAMKAFGIVKRKAAMLVQAKFLFSQRRHPIFTEWPPARLYFLSTRPSMPPGAEFLAGTIAAKGGKLDYLWMVWDNSRPFERTECFWLARGKATIADKLDALVARA